MDSHPVSNLVNSNSPYLHLTHPTAAERLKIWTTTASTWGIPDELLPLCLQRFEYLTTIPLAKNGGMTMWILTDSQYPPENRPLLSSCDTFRKRALSSDAKGNNKVRNGIVHGIASVFTPPIYRRRGYASRLARELARALPGWQTAATSGPCIGTILYSDIGRTYYARLGWEVAGSNTEYILEPASASAPASVPAPELAQQRVLHRDLRWPPHVKAIAKSQLAELCSTDESMLWKAMSGHANANANANATAASEADRKRLVAIIPDLEHMLWHMAKDEFMAELYLGVIPLVKGAVAIGGPGQRVWAIWTHSYYSHPLGEEVGKNGLYILRVVVEDEHTAIDTPTTTTAERSDQLEQSVKAVLQAAQCEAREWGLDYVNLWEPSESVRGLVKRCGIRYHEAQRAEEGIACGMWYGEGGQVLAESPVWIHNERYAYC